MVSVFLCAGLATADRGHCQDGKCVEERPPGHGNYDGGGDRWLK